MQAIIKHQLRSWKEKETNNGAIRWRGLGRKSGRKNTNNNMEDDLKVKNTKKGTNYWWNPCRIWKLQKPILSDALLEKGTRNDFETVENFEKRF